MEEHVRIEMSDGVHLSARLWFPEDVHAVPMPAVLEYIPYRKRDFSYERDARLHPYVAAHGYVSVRVDLRGSGDSEGLLTDEYLDQELDDAEEVIRWLRAQPFCNGRVGMMGISWGGFNALQVAARNPVGLEAIVTACSTDDRYADDVHYMGGCLLGDNLSWAATMLAYTTLPPDPDLHPERWSELWQDRLRGSGVWLKQWLSHQRRDAYWRHGSICEDYDAVKVPVFAISGWADGYSNAVFRLIERLRGPRLGLIGPWGHRYPHEGVPGPAIGFLQELVRFWNRWLKDEDNGIMEEPRLRLWLQDSVEPATAYDVRPGRWVGEPCWPSPNVEMRRFRFEGYTLQPEPLEAEAAANLEPDARSEFELRSPLTLGEFAGKWCSFSALPQLPPDQRQEDGGALVFDSEPLSEPLEVVGAPEIEVMLASDEAVALLAARLSDVRPDRATTRVSYGLLNLTHRDGHAEPKPLQVGKRYRVRLQLNRVAQVFPAGHRLRIALSTSYWPVAWVPPKMATLTIDVRGCALLLPVRHRDAPSETEIAFGEPEGAAPPTVSRLNEEHNAWRVTRDLAEDCSTHEVIRDGGRWCLHGSDTEISRRVVERYTVSGDDVDSACGTTEWQIELRKPACEGRTVWAVRVVTRMRLASDAEGFYIDADIDAYDSQRRVYAQTHHYRIQRDLL